MIIVQRMMNGNRMRPVRLRTAHILYAFIALVGWQDCCCNIEKETDTTFKILQLVLEASLYKSLCDKQDSVLVWIPNE